MDGVLSPLQLEKLQGELQALVPKRNCDGLEKTLRQQVALCSRTPR